MTPSSRKPSLVRSHNIGVRYLPLQTRITFLRRKMVVAGLK